MAHRYDKYNGVTGGFRGTLAASWPDDEANPTARHVGLAHPVGLDGSGNLVPGGGADGKIRGVLVVDSAKPAGAVVDVMTAGEIADFDFYDAADSVATNPGEDVQGLDAGGPLQVTAAGAGKEVGFVVQTNNHNRLIVRVGPGGVTA